jgi:hypothetical protein
MEHGAQELWFFGSAATPACPDPGDIDIAILGVNRSARQGLIQALFDHFPDCRVEAAQSYTTGSAGHLARRPLHFVLTDKNDWEFPRHSISESINLGKRLWRAKK